jgi:hypothetical protein
MGLRCLFGHDFGEPELEREREEDGDEMVVTVREVKTCTRCGKTQVVSENKEVTAIRDSEAVGLDEESAAAEDATTGGDDAWTGDAVGAETAAEDDAEFIDDDADETPAADDADDSPAVDDADETPTADDAPADAVADADEGDAGAVVEGDEDVEIIGDDETGGADETTAIPDAEADDATPVADAEGDAEPSAESDDGVILDEEPRERERGEWPDPDGTRSAEESDAGPSLEDVGGDMEVDPDDPNAAEVKPGVVDDDAEFIDDDDDVSETEPTSGQTPWPEQGGDDEGFDAEPRDGESTDVSFGGGLKPEMNGEPQAEDGSEAAAYVGGSDEERELEEMVRAERSEVELESDPGATVEFYCPNCGVSQPAGESSMRAGDICPECHRGYIAERERSDGAQ